MLSYSSLVNKGKLTLPSVDSWGTNNNIRKDPPRSITTRRIDKVSDNNDITKMIDNSDRSSEAILRFSRGVNPSVSVSYSNNGGIMQNFGHQQAFLPYRINKDNDFHPPVQAPQDLLPLSRLPVNTIKVNTTPSLPHFTKELDNSRNQTAAKNVKQEMISASVSATKTYMLQKPFQEPFEVKYTIQQPLSVSANPTKIAFSDRTVQNNITPTKNIVIDHINISAETNKNETKNNKPFNSFDFSNIKTQDVQIIEYTTSLKGNEKTEFIHENFELERNIPVYDLQTNMQGLSHIKFAANDSDIHLTRNVPEYQTQSNFTSNKKYNIIHKDLELERNIPEYQLFSNVQGNKASLIRHDKDMELQRNIPEYNLQSNLTSGNKISFVHDDIILERNVPEYNSFSNISGNQKTDFIHEDIELDRVLPEHEAQTNISQNLRKTNLHEKMKDYERKMVLSNLSTNDSKTGDITKVNSRDFYLQDKLQPGEFHNAGFVPKVERTHNINYSMNDDKLNMVRESQGLLKARNI